MPLVSALIAVRNDARHIASAVGSVLRQTVADLELIVVDDASTDETPKRLAEIGDQRVVVVANDEQLGLGGSLNRGLEHATGRYVARLDSDDAALPEWLERLLRRMRSEPRAAVVGTGIVEVDAAGRPGPLHRLPRGATAVRWHALFSAPFFHSTVLLDRETLDRHGFRYDSSYLESEDYELWTRLLAVADGDNLAEPLVLRRMHPGQAQARRGNVQRSLQREIALREIRRTEPALPEEEAELAWLVGTGQPIPRKESERAVDAYLALLDRFEHLNGVDRSVRAAAARALGRAGRLGRGIRLAPTAPLGFVLDRTRRPLQTRLAHRRAEGWLSELEPAAKPIRVAVVSPEPTPYRSPLFDRVAAHPELELRVIYAARTLAGRTWTVELPSHPVTYLRGVRLPGLRRLLRHDYPVTPGIRRALRETRPEVVVVSGWSTFASQAAVAWCRAHRIPYVLLVESHDLGPRAGWRRLVKGGVVPRLLRAAAGVLVVGTAARESVIARGAVPERVRLFANTVDVAAWSARADRLSARRGELRRSSGLAEEDVVALSVARLAPEKGLDLLLQAVAEAGDGRLRLRVAGSGPRGSELAQLAVQHGVRLALLGDLTEEELAQEYVKADVFALLSLHEPWGVVVNEAAASGLPLVLSDRVGAAYDLLRDGENGFLVRSGDVQAAARALKGLAADPALRREAGARSRDLVRGWGYGPSVENFVTAVREATAR
jgi:glycosyltransferase involved in cell wall biosynthesis